MDIIENMEPVLDYLFHGICPKTKTDFAKVLLVGTWMSDRVPRELDLTKAPMALNQMIRLLKNTSKVAALPVVEKHRIMSCLAHYVSEWRVVKKVNKLDPGLFIEKMLNHTKHENPDDDSIKSVEL